MQLTGLFLGAGASFEAGMPLVWELTAELKDWLTGSKLRKLNEGWRLQGSGHSDHVIEDVISVLERSNVHYEAILGHIETQFRRQTTFQQDYHGLYSWLVDTIYYLLYYRQVNNEKFFRQALPYYNGIEKLANTNRPLWIFSLNHDIMIEAIAEHLSIPLHSGFSSSRMTLPLREVSGRKIGELRTEVLTKDELENGAFHFPNPSQPGICLLKIHGALDIFTFNNGEDLLKLLPSTEAEGGIISALKAANEKLIFPSPGAPSGKVKVVNEIAYADDKGEMQFLRRTLLAGAFKFDKRHTQVLPQSLLSHFKSNINFVSHLVCVGYGFGDLHINAVLRDWLESAPERRLEIVNPGIRDIPPFLLHLSLQVALTNRGATDYFDSCAGIVRSPRDIARRKLMARLRGLSNEQASAKLNGFMQRRTGRLAQAMFDRLKSLPIIDGKPDFSSLGDPRIIAEELMSNKEFSEEEFVNQFSNFLREEESK